MTVVKPKRLEPGEKIGVIAPAGPVLQSELQSGIDVLESSGFGVIIAPHLYHVQDYLAGDDEARLQDLHNMFGNKKVKAIICARGGYGALRLLDKIDYDLIRANPKIFVGYSDITAMLLAIFKKTGLVTFHGPIVKDISKNSRQNLKSLFDMVCSKTKTGIGHSGGRALVPGKATGALLGGNLSLICYLSGTPFMPSLKDAILFIEERGEALYRIDRMLTHLRLSGLLEGAAGIIAGQFEDCGDPSAIDRLLVDTFSGLNIPIFSGLPVGHGLVNLPLPIGLEATLDTDTTTLSIMETCVAA
ncbi:LD-carboxypeptidase [bacterium]|nr:LD-carboxypeptidase [bacterium]